MPHSAPIRKTRTGSCANARAGSVPMGSQFHAGSQSKKVENILGAGISAQIFNQAKEHTAIKIMTAAADFDQHFDNESEEF